MTWGIEASVIERFAKAGIPQNDVSFVRDTYRFNFPGAHRASWMNSDATMVPR
jgi:hypothetical protein